MSHHHPHAHPHTHHRHSPTHAQRDFGLAFALGAVLNLSFVIVEFIYGHLAHSLALVADAGHNLSDVLGLLLAWGASVLARRQATPRRTYGLRRSSILAALFNAITLFIAVGAIAWEAVLRLNQPVVVANETVMIVAAVGIVINGLTAWLFMSGSQHDMNIRGVFLHMLLDAAVSLSVVLVAVAIRFTQWLWLDPAISLLIVLVIVVSTWSLLREALNLALDAVPKGIRLDEVEAYLAGLPNVQAVHDLHIWGLSTTETALTVHLVKPDAVIDDALLARINRDLHHLFGIEQTTVQFELGDTDYPCSKQMVKCRTNH